ncbi:MAG: TolC family protein [Candidatus Neomarinimicrobiota bacterium]
MKIRSNIIVLIAASLLSAEVPDPLTLDFCQEQTRANYPLIKQSELLSSAADQKIRNLTSNWWPQFTINGQSSYQSDVTSIDLPPGSPITIPIPAKDSYKVTLDISNTVYDGGLTRRQKELEQTGLQVDQQNLEVELYRIRERINQVFFTALLLQENEKLLRVMSDEIKARLAVVESGVRNGVVLASNADVLRAELVKIDQQLMEIMLGRESVLEILSEYFKQPVPPQVQFAVPVSENPPELVEITRPELSLMNLQARKIDASKSLLSARLRPRAAVFGQIGYGQPGLNMLSPDFDDFYMFGVRLSWTPWNWNQTRREKQWFDLQKNIILTQKETFEQQIRILLRKDRAEIRKFEALIGKDDEIIVLRAKITGTIAAQLENGVVTATEYLTELNAETQARLNKQLHLIRLASARADYQFDSGKKD